MPELRISENVVIQVPGDVEARARPLSTGRRGAADGRMDAVDRALVDADLIIDSEIELSPVPRRPGGGTRTARRGEEPAPSLTVSVGSGENAVVLIESEGGVFGWVLPGQDGAGSRRSAARERTLHFPLTNAVTPAGGTDRRGRRGIASWIGNRLVDPIRLRVLRYAARTAIDLTVDAVEGNRTFGLVDMAGPSSSWRPGARLPAFPPGRPARILLLVHGTFSTTAGSFAPLELTAPGRTFLDKARAKYDAVIGFDHRTLAHDPEQNARDILEALSALPKNSSIDTIGYSRGGLVLRSLIEQLVPESRADLSFGRTVFVGCTNGGTYLANPENWHALVDLYTNIVMAGARAASLVSANVAAEVISAGISTLGRFVKLLPDVAITQRRLPGLAAMEPHGTFVGSLNSAAPLEAGPEYYVIASDFEPRINPAKGITGELAKYLVDRVADRFFKNLENDLVVDSQSMSQFGRQSARLQKDRLNVLPSADSVYHTIYFAADKVGELLSAWLLKPERRTRSRAGPSDPLLRSANEPTTSPTLPRPPFPGGILESMVTRYSVPIQESHVGKADFEKDFLGIPDDLDDASGMELESLDDDGPMPAPEPVSRAPRPTRSTPRRSRAAPAADQPPDRPAGDTAAETASDTDSASTACHFAAEMQPTPVLGVPVPLYVTVSPERIAVAAGATAATTADAVAVDRMKKLEIEVIPSRNCRIFGAKEEGSAARRKRKEGPSLKFMAVPTKSDTLRFEIEGIAPGEAEIFVEARQGSRLLASFLLKPVFVLASDVRISASQIAHATASLEDDPAVMRIYEMHKAEGLSLRFELSCEKPNISVLESVALRPNFNLGAFVAMFLTKLEEAYDLDDYDLMLEEITNFSIVRTTELIPEEVRRELWKHRAEIKAIQVISEEPLIPWELLCVADPDGDRTESSRFLAEWGLVRWMYNAPWPSRELKLRPERVFNVIPDYLNPADDLAGAAEERAMLAKRFPQSSALEARSRDVRKFLRDRATGCDLLHFACHGIAEQKAVLSSDLIMRESEGRDGLVEDRLTQDDVKADAAFGDLAPSGIVFINACQTGRPGEGIAGVMGFADAFVRPLRRQGVNVFVGALWSVDDVLALTFADTFYGELLNGRTLVEATKMAREACKQNRDFTWLAYSLYGHPFAKVN